MPKQKRPKTNYLFFGNEVIPTKYINNKDFEFIDDIKNIAPEDYPRVFTVTKGGMYNHYKKNHDYYFLLRKDIFKQQLKEISENVTTTRV
jgi:hypothetical protein